MTLPERLLGGRYEVGELLGYGGMAEVHWGRDLRLGRDVAIKMLRTDLARDHTFRVRFRREAQNAATLNHPGIAAVYDTGEEHAATGEALPYIVFEFIPGWTLKAILAAEGRLQPRRALEISADICGALEFSHRHGVIHRDVKPSNVMLTPNGQVKVADFGISMASGVTTMTQTSAVIGTVFYLSPEQARGAAVDARSDVYATGCVLFELLCGHPPFVGDSPISVAYQHIEEDPPPPSQHDPEIGPDVDAVVLRALSKNPADRYQSAAEMRADLLRAAAGRPVLANPVQRDEVIPGVQSESRLSEKTRTRWYASFASRLGHTTTFTFWQKLTTSRLERVGKSLTSVESGVRTWKPPTAVDFDISVYPVAAGGRKYVVMSRGSEGEGLDELRFPEALNQQLARVATVLNAAPDSRPVVADGRQAVEELGSALFAALLRSEARYLFTSCKDAARRRHSHLRLVLRLHAEELEALPWELMFDRESGIHLAIEHPLVRYIEMALPVSGLLVRPPMQMLGIVAAPNDLSPISINVEKAAVADALGDLVQADLVQLSWTRDQTWQGFKQKLQTHQYHAIQFIGHSRYDEHRQEGCIAFVDLSGRSDRVPASEVGAALAEQRSLRLAILNTSESFSADGRDGLADIARTLVRRGTGAVMSTRRLSSDPATRTLMTVFFDAVCAYAPIDVAAMMGRLAAKRERGSSFEWATTSLYLRSTNATLIDR
jgi:serine/threonine protein kinase